MNDAEYQKLYELETTYWWHVGRRYIISSFIDNLISSSSKFDNGNQAEELTGAKILDVGSGTGENLKFLSQFGETIGIDNSERAVEFSKKRGLNNLKIGEAENLPFADNSFELVTMLDLLEHISNDSRALKEANRTLKPKGHLLVTVPAYPSLWSEHDEALNHKRRYSKRELTKKIEQEGFLIKRASFAITTFLPPISLYRALQNASRQKTESKTSYVFLPGWLNKIFIGVLRAEAKAIKKIDLPFGLSLVALAEKPNKLKINDKY